MPNYSCQCGAIERNVNQLNDVMKDLVCPKCSTKLTSKSISEQVKLDHYIQVQDDESTETRRQEIYSYLLGIEDATDSEIQKALGYKDRNCISPRRYELVQMGLCKENGKRLCAVTNKKVTAWKALE